MYTETEPMLSYSTNLHQEVQQHDEFCGAQKITDSSEISISGYNLWGGGDLFKAPEPVMEETAMGLDPMTAALSMISCGEDVISPQSLTVSNIESSIKSGQILSEVFYECRKDLLAKEGNETPLSEVIHIELPNDKRDAQNVTNDDDKQNGQLSFQKSVSSHCLHSMDIAHQTASTPCFPVINFGTRRAFSEGDIKTLDNNTSALNFPPVQPPQVVTTTTNTIVSEERKEKLSRYRIKKSKRNFGHKVKYACRKALADSQPRIRGRFAKADA